MSADLTSLITDEAALARVVTAQMKDNRWRDLTPLAIAKAVLASDWLAAHDREVAAGAVKAAAGPSPAMPGYKIWFNHLCDRAQAIREGRATDGE